MTKEEKELKKDILYCLEYLQKCINGMARGMKVSAESTEGMIVFANQIATVISKYKKANILLSDKTKKGE